MTEQVGSETAPQTGERKPVEKVISGEAVQRKKSLGRKLAETFTGDSIQGAGSFVIKDVVIPQLRILLVEAGQQTIERIFLGESGASRRRTTVTSPLVGNSQNRTRNSSYNSYNKYFQGNPGSENKPMAGPRASNELPEIVVPSRVDAQEVLDNLNGYLDQYRNVSVAVLYQMLGWTPKFTDEKWGWVDLDTAGISRVTGGYRVDLPRLISLD